MLSAWISQLSFAEQDALCRLLRAEAFIRRYYAQRISLEEIAKQACWSQFHFLRRFKQVFGITPHELLLSVRLAQAKTLLLESEQSITEVCLEIGYDSLGSFSSLFLREAGCTPRAYRNRRSRFWPVGISFDVPFIPFCFQTAFGVGPQKQQDPRSLKNDFVLKSKDCRKTFGKLKFQPK